MKSIIQLTFILIIILFFTTCKKDLRHTFVEGIAQDYYTKEPIADAQVELIGPGGDQYGVITSVYTDANGHFEFEKYRAEKSGDYYINISGKNYDSYNIDGSGNVKTGKKNDLRPSITTKVNVTFITNNINFLNDSDRICLFADYTADFFVKGEITSEACFYGDYYRESKFKTVANVPILYNYSVRRNSLITSHVMKIIYTKDTTINFNY